MFAGVGHVIVGVVGTTVASDIVMMSTLDVPSVQIKPIWLLDSLGYPARKLRVCVPTFVFGTADHGDHDVPLNFVYRIEFAASVLMQNSQMLLMPSVAPKSPVPALNAWPVPKAGGAGDIADHVFVPAAYDAPSMAVPAAFRRNA